MKKLNKILLSTFVLIMVFSTITSYNVVAIESPDETYDILNSDSAQQKIEANVRTMYRFRYRTQLTFHANINLEVKIQCEALRIGVKDFVLEIEGNNDLSMNMTCTREEVQLGLKLGNTYRFRNRNTYRYQEGFCCLMECNGTFLQARLRIRATNENRVGTWAYYNKKTSEWEPVPTSIEDGYLTAVVDSFSYWTVLIPDNTALIIGITVGAGIIGAIAIIAVKYYKKRK